MVGSSIPNNEMFLVWIGIFLMAIFFNETFISALAVSLQATLLSMYGLSMLPNFAYTWNNIVASFILSKVGVIVAVVFVVVFLIGLLAKDDNKKTENKTNNINIENNNKDFKFASFYIKGYDESICYSLYSSDSNWAILRDENGNMITVHIWNEEDGSLEDDTGNIYRPL